MAGLPKPEKRAYLLKIINRFFVFIIIMTVVTGGWVKTADPSAYIYKGIASWYSEDDPGILETTANMEKFDDKALTCAIWDLPFDTMLKVTNVKNGRDVIVRVNDRGPAKRLGRAIDLTKEAFSRIADINQGLVDVTIEVL